jgi:hypothetical protein
VFEGNGIFIGAIMDLMKVIVLLFGVMLSACADASNTQVLSPGLPHSDSFRVQRSRSAEYDYLVSIKNGKDLGINADDQAARDRMALLALKNQCEAPQIIRETIVKSGAQLLGGEERAYELQVKC